MTCTPQLGLSVGLGATTNAQCATRRDDQIRCVGPTMQPIGGQPTNGAAELVVPLMKERKNKVIPASVATSLWCATTSAAKTDAMAAAATGLPVAT
eukprot:4453327-Prymnesium_polylepis.1